MDTLKLRQEFAARIEAAKSIKAAADAAKREITEEESGQITALLDDAKQIRAKADAADARARLLNDLSDAAEYLDKPLPRQVRGDAETLRDAYTDRQGGDAMPWNQLRAGSRGKLIAYPGPKARENAYRVGMWASAALFGNQRAMQWCRDKGVPILGANLMQNGQVDIQAVAGGTNPSGEYLVPEEMNLGIIDLRETFGVARQLAAIQVMNREVMTINKRVSGLTMYPVGRVLAAAITQSDKVWGQIELRANTWAGLALVSRDLMDDAVINLADDLTAEFAYAAADAEDSAYFLGDGTSTYHGIWGINRKLDATIGAGQLVGAVDAATNHDTFAEIDAADLAKVTGKAPEYVEKGGNAKWVCSKLAWAAVFQRLAAAAGGNTVDHMTGQVGKAWLGDPVVISQKMPATSDTTDYSDDTMLLYGDFRRGSVIGDRMTFSAQVLNERYAELRQVGIIGANRWDINVFGTGDATNAGPILGLIGE